MENLNAENIKRGLACCKGSYDCFTCDIYKRGCAGWREGLAKDALALINSQEQRIGELENRLRYLLQSKTIAEYDEVDIHTKKYVKDIHSLDTNIKGLTEEKNEVFEKGAENLNRVEEAYLKLEAENLKLTDENERLIENNKQIVTDAVRSVSKFAAQNEMLRGVKSEYETFIGELKPKIDTIRAEAKADTVKEMQERLKQYIDVGHYRSPTEICFSELDVANIIDRIAKEMLGDAE